MKSEQINKTERSCYVSVITSVALVSTGMTKIKGIANIRPSSVEFLAAACLHA